MILRCSKSAVYSHVLNILFRKHEHTWKEKDPAWQCLMPEASHLSHQPVLSEGEDEQGLGRGSGGRRGCRGSGSDQSGLAPHNQPGCWGPHSPSVLPSSTRLRLRSLLPRKLRAVHPGVLKAQSSSQRHVGSKGGPQRQQCFTLTQHLAHSRPPGPWTPGEG